MLSPGTSYGSTLLLPRTIQACPTKDVRAEGIQRDYQLGRKLLRRSLINCSSVLRTFVNNLGKPLRYYRGTSYSSTMLLLRTICPCPTKYVSTKGLQR